MELGIEEALKGKYIFVDLRSEKEYGLSHIPFATSLPILDDTARELIGYTYKNQGRDKAVKLGYDHVLPKLSSLVQEIEALLELGELVIYCSRGGMRSDTLYRLLAPSHSGLHKLIGGYKSYRNFLLENLPIEIEKRKLLVFQGLTGVGKTRILNELKGEFEVLDLEEMASHRGSVFGGLGLDKQPTQKQFENNLFNWIYSAKESILVEAESSKIGNLFLPTELKKKMQNSPVVLLEASLSSRVKLLEEEYSVKLLENRQELIRDIWKLKKQLGKKTCQELEGLLLQGSMAKAIEILLLYYYDPLYSHSIKRGQDRVVEDFNIDEIESIEEIGRRINEILYT